MITTRVKFQGSKLRLGGYGPDKYQMFKLGRLGLQSIKERVSRGIGSNDAPMPRLSRKQHAVFVSKDGKKQFVRLSRDKGYEAFKQRKTGRSTRDLNFTGKMLDNFSVRYADAKQVRLDITSRDGRIKARANEKRSPWFGFNRADTRKIFLEAAKMFRGNLKDIGVKLRGFGTRGTVFANKL